MTTEKYTMRLSLQVLQHLGFNLYSNIPAVLSEVVANSYDADADEVSIVIENDKITIKDDGNGMDLKDINDKFLYVGYQKRKENALSEKYKRQVMGRKGIGKLSLFSIAENIEIQTKKGNDINGFILNRSDIENQITSSEEYHPKDVPVSQIDIDKGTRIIITKIDKNVNQTEAFLKRRLARRFSVIGDSFKVKVNDDYITIEDRDYFKKMQFLWLIGDTVDIYSTKFTNIQQINRLDGSVKSLNKSQILYNIKGWIGTVEKPYDLEQDSINNNKVSIICRGKLAQEDILKVLRESGIFATYLIGEIEADFLDDSTMPDIATSSRQGIKEEDERYEILLEHIRPLVKDIKRVWTNMRLEEKKKEAINIIQVDRPAVYDWFNSLRGIDTQNKAKELFATIESFHFDDTEEKEKKKELYKQGVIAFEKLQYRDNLSSLSKIQTISDLELATIFTNLNDIEANNYYDIAKERVEVIKLFDKKLNDNEKEKLIQEHLFNNLWLLNPSWERATEGSEEMEKRFAKAKDDVIKTFSEEEKKARYDIKYRTASDKHILVELKRYTPSYHVDSFTLAKQAKKYKDALSKCLFEAGQSNPHIEIIILLGDRLNENPKEVDDSLRVYNARIIYYNALIEQSLQSYSLYLERNKQIGKLRELIEKI